MSYMIMIKADELCPSLPTLYGVCIKTQACQIFERQSICLDPGVLFRVHTHTVLRWTRTSLESVIDEQPHPICMVDTPTGGTLPPSLI